MTVYFDITTSALWRGHAVGIVRVERELARRAVATYGDDLRFCVYAKARGIFMEVDRRSVGPILDGELQLGAALTAGAGPGWSQHNTGAVMPARDLLTTVLAGGGGGQMPLARQVHRMLRTMDLAQVARLRRMLNDNVEIPLPRLAAARSTAADTLTPLKLGPADIVISGGLDWEHKDIVRIQDMKQAVGFRYIAILYDLIPLLYPQFVVPSYVHLLAGYFGELFWTADVCLCISETTARDVRDYLARHRMTGPKVMAFPLGSDIRPAQAAVGEARLPPALGGRTFALFVSTIEPRKNHRVIYQAFSDAVARGKLDPSRHAVVFVGRVGWNIDNLIHDLKSDPHTRDAIVILDNVSDAELAALYRAAAFVVFPSFYEGYGLSLVEALAFDKVVVASDAPALREIGGERVTYLSPHDTLGWRDTMVALFTGGSEAKRARGRMRKGQPPTTWDDSARAFFGAIARWEQAP